MASQDIQIVKLPLEEPIRGRWRRMAMVVGLTLLVSAPGFIVVAREHYSTIEAADRLWRVDGRPCAPLSAKAFWSVSRRPSLTPYDGAVYGRHGGAMFCTHRTAPVGGAPVRYPVCKFDAPDYLAVTAGGREQFYDLTMGRAATVWVVNGQVRCVVSPPFEM
ncbi:hypothetical protein [Caulobacter sp.]|uniref:hypothetical protein n=1 Tax=Caulobacter sp. TaxID=78 RepID=UPI002B477EC8|nr:hypothetical protein [Caulobacter sp.]HJV43127.1 hypothetical protein [Caulobacter sp.]